VHDFFSDRSGCVRKPTDPRAASDYSNGLTAKTSRKAGRPARVSTVVAPAELAVLFCQTCDALLTFASSTEGGVVPVEHWDRYDCGRCGGVFEYRRRTRALKRSA
jgi:ribosomal protein S27AE